MNFCFQQTENPNNKNMHGMIYKRILATQKNMEQGAAVVFFLNLSKYRFFFQLIQVVTVMESRCLTASIFFHRFFFGPFFLGLPGPCPMAKLNDKSKV